MASELWGELPKELAGSGAPLYTIDKMLPAKEVSLLAEAIQFSDPIEPKLLGDTCALRMKEAILRGELRPGAKLSETDLARTFNLSRSPIRDALRLLSKEGLVQIVPHRGATVREFTPREILDHSLLRERIESLGVRLATDRAPREEIAGLKQKIHDSKRQLLELGTSRKLVSDREFHDGIIKLADSEMLRRIMSPLVDQGMLFWNVFYPGCERRAVRLRSSLDEMLLVFEAMEEGDADTAEERMRAHVRSVRKCILGEA